MTAENTCEIVEGRLVEINVAAGYRSADDVRQMTQLIRAKVASVPEPTQLIIAADWRNCPLFKEDVSASIVQMLMTTNTRIERSAILHRSDQPTSVLQVFRLVKEAHQDHRRVFHNAEEMRTWLGELLNPEERRRLQAFLPG
jgi:hypothetical protein